MELFISAYAACFENIPKANSSKAISLSQRFGKAESKKTWVFELQTQLHMAYKSYENWHKEYFFCLST